MKVIISAAGTGGHINPGIAIANKIKEKHPNSKIIFIGTNRGLENDLVPRAGFELKTIEAYGLRKEISIKNIKRNDFTFLYALLRRLAYTNTKICKFFDHYWYFGGFHGQLDSKKIYAYR